MSVLYLHVGHGKTGSSYLQSALSLSQDILSDQDVFYLLNEGGKSAAQGKIKSGNGNLLESFFEKNDHRKISKGDGSFLAADSECNTCPVSYGVHTSNSVLKNAPPSRVSRVQGMSLRHIARILGRALSTISREVRRNRAEPHIYCARRAQQQRHKLCRPKHKLVLGTERFELIVHMLRQRLSPE